MGRLNGKVAVITGAAQGMGEAHARGFIAEGARIVLTDINADAGAALAADLGADAQFLKHDVTREEDWRAVVAETERRYGPINVLVNNAGVVGTTIGTVELTEKEFNAVCAINQTGPFLGMKHCIPSMLRAGGGSIINISSISGIVAIYGTPNAAYAASKFAVRGLTKFAAIEYGPKNIRVNSVHPGYIRTPMADATLVGEAMQLACNSVPVKRMADPSEVTELVIFLASDSSRFITGSEHIIDGGLTSL